MEQALHLLLAYKYAVLIPLALVEGPTVALVAGVMVSLGYLDFFVTYWILIAKDMVMDSFYYFLGIYGDKKSVVVRFGSKVGITEHRFNSFKKLWEVHIFKTMFFSKLAYGLGAPLLVSAGLARVPAKKFYIYALPVALFQYAVLMSLGAYFGESYTHIAGYVKDVEILIAGLAVLVGTYFVISFSFRKKVLEE